MMEADVDHPTATNMIEAIESDIGPTVSDMIEADIDPTGADMMEADMGPTASDMIEADMGLTASDMMETDVDPTAANMMEANVDPTASDMMEADVDPTASDMMEADVDPTASDMMERDEPHHAMRRGWRDVLLSLLLSICVCSLLVVLLRASLSTPPPTTVTRQPLHGYSEHHQPIVAKSVDMMHTLLPSFSPERKSLGIYKHTRSVTQDRVTRYTRRRSVSSQQLLQEGHALFPPVPSLVDNNSPKKRHAHFA
jgi:hypothetical protein